MQSEWKMPRDIQGDFDIIQFELYMYQIDAYVRWESLGGGPHFRISTIRGVGQKRNISDNECLSAYEKVIKKIETFPVKFNNTNSRFYIDLLDLENFLIEADVELPMCKKAESSYVYSDSNTLAQTREMIKAANIELKERQETTLHTFRGEELRVTVEELDVTEDMEKNLADVVHPDVTNFILHKLEIFINHHFIKNYGK
jgi:hypothetical protein